MAAILLAEARFYPDFSDMLLEGARSAIEPPGISMRRSAFPALSSSPPRSA
jgi:hypothetical protein